MIATLLFTVYWEKQYGDEVSFQSFIHTFPIFASFAILRP